MADIELIERLKQIRGDRTMTEFARKVGSSKQNISAYENEVHTPTLASVCAIAKKENINLNWLCLGEGEMYRRR